LANAYAVVTPVMPPPMTAIVFMMKELSKRQELSFGMQTRIHKAPPLFMDLRDSRWRVTAIACSFGALTDEFASSSSELGHVTGPFA
jgi:hypothetical protein